MNTYIVVKPLINPTTNQTCKPDEKVSLSGQQAKYLLLQGKIKPVGTKEKTKPSKQED
ncbi:hypothetical protein [uncultured Desulfuromusa sp.]|uniref:hypothetical protein n=1 Tax=uncultured Desulfuromusa sp. TaxID=219183 RepID=UPI002AA6E310|nr:hypothetical protein [uncultured Desulfuromusa sp.]